MSNATATAVTKISENISGRNSGLKGMVEVGNRVEFRCYGYNQQYATGKVIRMDEKGVVVRVDRAMCNARVEWDDLTMVIR